VERNFVVRSDDELTLVVRNPPLIVIPAVLANVIHDCLLLS